MKKRCAIYTRKSHEEGLEQEFNSLHAQREACEAYIKSQQHEGWKLIKNQFNDGGFSGGTLDRPAVQELLEIIKAGRVDVIVVYKVDRLTRSLADFAKLVELFDEHDVSFVSVTQQFNTTTSMGRLTLNVLLSFAQFEREVTGERIRDKIAASKKKGMWMGGVVPLGYDNVDRKLVVNREEAERVRLIFDTYLKCGNVRDARAELLEQGVRGKGKPRTSVDKRSRGNLSRGAIYTILKNPIYIGKVRNHGELFEGQHKAIVDAETWQKVQEMLAAQAMRETGSTRKTEPSPLAGVVFDEHGTRLTPSHTSRHGRRYRYYATNQSLQSRNRLRFPAKDLEKVVLAAIRDWLRSLPERLAGTGERLASAADRSALNEGVEELLTRLDPEKPDWDCISSLCEKVTVSAKCVNSLISKDELQSRLNDLPGAPDLTDSLDLEITVPCQLTRNSRGACLVVEATSDSDQREPDQTLVQALAKAQHWWELLKTGAARSFGEVARLEGLGDSSYVSRLIKLAFLPPQLKRDILDGRQPADMTLERLTRRHRTSHTSKLASKLDPGLTTVNP